MVLEGRGGGVQFSKSLERGGVQFYSQYLGGGVYIFLRLVFSKNGITDVSLFFYM